MKVVLVFTQFADDTQKTAVGVSTQVLDVPEERVDEVLEQFNDQVTYLPASLSSNVVLLAAA